jgi:hypothetical protein
VRLAALEIGCRLGLQPPSFLQGLARTLAEDGEAFQTLGEASLPSLRLHLDNLLGEINDPDPAKRNHFFARLLPQHRAPQSDEAAREAAAAGRVLEFLRDSVGADSWARFEGGLLALLRDPAPGIPAAAAELLLCLRPANQPALLLEPALACLALPDPKVRLATLATIERIGVNLPQLAGNLPPAPVRTPRPAPGGRPAAGPFRP